MWQTEHARRDIYVSSSIKWEKTSELRIGLRLCTCPSLGLFLSCPLLMALGINSCCVCCEQLYGEAQAVRNGEASCQQACPRPILDRGAQPSQAFRSCSLARISPVTPSEPRSQNYPAKLPLNPWRSETVRDNECLKLLSLGVIGSATIDD